VPRALRSSQLTFSRPDDGLLGTGMGEQGTTQLPAPRSSPPAQGGGGKRASVARTVEAANPIRQAISRAGMPPTNFTKHFAHMAHCGPLCWHQVPPLDSKGTPRFSTNGAGARSCSDRRERPERALHQHHDRCEADAASKKAQRRSRLADSGCEDTFRQRSPNFKPLQRYNRCAARVTPTFSERYMVPV